MNSRTIYSELLAQYLIARSAREDRALEAAAFLAHSQTRSVSARSFVQDSGARSWARGGIRHSRRSQLIELVSCARTLAAASILLGCIEALEICLTARGESIAALE